MMNEEHSKGKSMRRKALFLIIVAFTIAGCIFQSDEKPKLKNPLDPNSDVYVEAAVSELNIENGQKFYASEITVTWKGNANAAQYQCVLGDSTYAWNTSSWIKLTNLTPGEYLFNITPRNQAGFSGQQVDCLFTVLEPPAVDTISIENGQVFTTQDIEVTWTGNTTATSYIYSLNDQPGEWSDATTASFEGLENGAYNLTITAKNEDFTGTQKTWTFIVDTESRLLTITGKVTGADDVTILLGGDASAGYITDDEGIYTIDVMDGSTYTLTPQKQGYSFEPESVNLTELSTDITQNFTAALNTHTISGSVAGADGVTVQLTGNAEETVFVDNGGSYSFTVDALGSYVVAVSCIGYHFSNDIVIYPTILEDSIQSFEAIQDNYTITGSVTGADSVTVNLSGDSDDSVVVNDGGSYLFSVTSLGTYTVSVEKEGVSFPISQETFHYLLRDETQDFVAAISDIITIRGLITGLDDVTVRLSGDKDGNQIIDDGDHYEFIVEESGTYTVSVFKEACMFDIYQVTFENVTQSNIQNFSGQLIPEHKKNQFLEYAQNGYITQIEALLEDIPLIFTVKDNDGNTSLHWVALRGNKEIVQLLLDRGANIEAKNNDGYTPLSQAANQSDTEIVRLLLDRGADIGAKDNHNNTPLHISARRGYTETVWLLLDRGADIEAKDNYFGLTPLHGAAENGRTETVRLLLDRGADIGAKSEYNRTPLHCAVRWGDTHLETIQLLLDRGADIEVKDNGGYTSLLLAVLYEFNIETVRLLLDRGADIEAKTYFDSSTPLNIVATRDDTETARLLLERGADIEAINYTGSTPLHSAASQGSTDTVQLLLDNGANVNSLNNFNNTPLDYAEYYSHTEIVEILRAAGGKRFSEL